MTPQKISAWMAIVGAIIGGPLKILRILRQDEWWPSRIIDFIAIGMLLVGAILVLRGKSGRLLAAGWGFSIAMFYGSFFSHYQMWSTGRGDLAFEHTMVTWTGAFLLMDIVWLVLALWPVKSNAVD